MKFERATEDEHEPESTIRNVLKSQENGHGVAYLDLIKVQNEPLKAGRKIERAESTRTKRCHS